MEWNGELSGGPDPSRKKEQFKFKANILFNISAFYIIQFEIKSAGLCLDLSGSSVYTRIPTLHVQLEMLRWRTMKKILERQRKAEWILFSTLA